MVQNTNLFVLKKILYILKIDILYSSFGLVLVYAACE